MIPDAYLCGSPVGLRNQRANRAAPHTLSLAVPEGQGPYGVDGVAKLKFEYLLVEVRKGTKSGV
jgi:hypothetical protein